MYYCYYFFWPHHAACGILVPRPGVEPRPSAVKAQSPNHWTAREFLVRMYLDVNLNESSDGHRASFFIKYSLRSSPQMGKNHGKIKVHFI